MKQRLRESGPEQEAVSTPKSRPVRQATPVSTLGDSLLHRQAVGGNQAVVRLLRSTETGPAADELAGQIRAERAPDGPEPARPVRTKLTVSDPGDPCEREASAVASRVVRRARPAMPALAGAALPALARLPEPAATGAFGGGLGSVESALAGPGDGQPMGLDLRESIEPHVGVDLSGVRVKQDGDADAAAKALGARAFTTGSTIFLAAGESPRDLELMAHEATHVAQQHGPGTVQPSLMRLSADDLPDFVLDVVRAIPGYTLLTLVTGKDLLTDRPVPANNDELIEELLTYGPFGASVAQVLTSMNVIGDIVTLVTDGLRANNLTWERVSADLGSAWDEMGITEDNEAIGRRYLNAILADVGRFVTSIVDRVIEIVRGVVAEVAEPHLNSAEIQPVWSLAKKVFHYDPLRDEEVNAPTVEILGDFLRLIGQEQALAQMQERGTLQQTADWLDTQFATFAAIKTDVGQLFSDAWAAIQPANLPNLLDTLPQLAQRAWSLLQRIISFGTTLVAKVLELVKQSLLGWLSGHADSIHGFRMITVIIGQDPFTGEQVPRTAANLIGGFISLLPNGEETYQKLAEAGVIEQAGARIENAMSRLGISLDMVISTFRGIWDSLQLADLLNPIGAFERIVQQFRAPIARIIEFVVEVIKVVVELILKLMNFPSDLLGSIISNAMQAIDDIKRDPAAFFMNMLEALKQGFVKFFDEIGTFLLSGLADWLFRGMDALGITKPPDLTLKSILPLVLQVLGITVDKLWEVLGRHIGEERVARLRGAAGQLSGAWQFITDVQEGGIGAIWNYVTDQLSNLWDTLLSMATEWIMSTIVERVVAKLLSMLDPTGIMAVVNSCIAFFNAVQSAIEYIRDILMIVDDYVKTFAAVAAGNVGPGAEKITKGLADAIPIAIGFLANQVGLGNIPEKVVEIIERLRELVDKAIDWLIGKAVQLGSAALNALTGGPADEQEQQQPQEQQQTGDVRTDVTNALLAALAGAYTNDEIAGIIAGIEERFRPAGLHQIALGPVDENGDSAILVAASPLAPAALLRVIRYDYSVRAAATLTFHSAVDVGGPKMFYPVRQSAEGGRVPHPQGGGNVMVAWGPSGQAGVVSPTPGPDNDPGRKPEQLTTDVVQMVSKNSFVAKNAKEDDNKTHAEVHMLSQIRSDLPDLSQLKVIDLQISRMPCAMCCADLSLWLDSISPTIPVRISWTSTHPTSLNRSCNFPTSERDIARLERPNVTLLGPGALFATQEEANRQASRSAEPVGRVATGRI